MTNNTATLPINNANVMPTTLFTPEQANMVMQYIMSGKAIVIIPNNELFNLPVSVKPTINATTEIKPKKIFNIDKFYRTKLNNLLMRNEIVHESGKGAKKGVMRDKAYNFLLEEAKKERTTIKIKNLLYILSEAGMKEEGRGLKYDIVKDVYLRLPEKALSLNNKKYREMKLNEIISALKELPLTNEFPRKMDKFMNDKLNDIVEVTAIN